MSTAIEPIKSVELEAQSEGRSFVQMIAEASRDPGVSVEKLERLMALKERFDVTQARSEFWAAMARLQPRLPRITKEGVILNYDKTVKSRYAKYEDIDAGLRPLLQEEGFSVFFRTELREKTLFVTAIVAHAHGHAEETTVPVPIDVSAVNSSGKSIRNAAQDMGSTFSYGKRYALCAAFNVITVNEDDDAQGEAAQPLTEDELRHIDDWLQHLGGTPAVRTAFAGYLKKTFNVSEIKDLKRGQLNTVINALKERANRQPR